MFAYGQHKWNTDCWPVTGCEQHIDAWKSCYTPTHQDKLSTLPLALKVGIGRKSSCARFSSLVVIPRGEVGNWKWKTHHYWTLWIWPSKTDEVGDSHGEVFVSVDILKFQKCLDRTPKKALPDRLIAKPDVSIDVRNQYFDMPCIHLCSANILAIANF